MTKNLKKMIFSCAAILLASMCPSLVFGMSRANNFQVVGVVEWYGNAPFPRLGLKTEDGTLYYLKTDKDKKEALESMHGYRISVEGIILDEKAPIEIKGAIPLQVKGWKKI